MFANEQNEIPIKNNTFSFKLNSYIPELPEDPNDAVIINTITNNSSSVYEIERDDRLSTIILDYDSAKYYMWKKSKNIFKKFKGSILENRKYLVKENKSLISERGFLSFLMKKMSNRKNLDKFGSSFKDMELSFQIKKKWGQKRELPKFAKESFSQYWKNINKLN